MTFNVDSPNNNQSPGVFPAQNRTNLRRLFENINADHLFTNSFAVNQGTHKQVSLTNRDTPTVLPDVNSILYAQEDTLGASQLHFWNGAQDYVLTPPRSEPAVTKGSVLIPINTQSAVIYTAAPSTQGTIFVNNKNSGTYCYALFFRSVNDNVRIVNISASTGLFPQPVAVGAGIAIAANSMAGYDVEYFITAVSM